MIAEIELTRQEIDALFHETEKYRKENQQIFEAIVHTLTPLDEQNPQVQTA